MRSLILILISILVSSCSKKNVNTDKVIFNVRKHISKKEGKVDKLDLKSIKIDSMDELAKYLYLENELKIKRNAIESLYEALEEKGRNVMLEKTIDIMQSDVEQLTEEYNNSSKKDVYYKCYVSVNYKEPDTIKNCLDQSSMVENCLVKFYYTDLLLDENKEVISALFELSDE